MTRARAVTRSFSGTTRGCIVNYILCINVFMGCENNAVSTRSMTFVTTTIISTNIFWWVNIIVALEETLEILEGVQVQITLTMVSIILDVFLGKRINKRILASLLSSCHLYL